MSRGEAQTLDDARREAAARLSAGGVPDAGLDARLLLRHATALDAVGLIADGSRVLGNDERARFEVLIARRLAREPVAHLLGRREFWGLDMVCGSAALVPRPETEGLVEQGLRLLEGVAGPRILDIGTGTGCVLAALLGERADAWGVAVDLSADALRLARANLSAHAPGRHTLYRGRWAEACEGSFDLVVSNPPYLREDEMEGLSPDVAREPALALVAGADGLDAYRALAPQAKGLLGSGGAIALEHGRGQSEAVRRILGQAGFADIEAQDDLAGLARTVTAQA